MEVKNYRCQDVSEAKNLLSNYVLDAQAKTFLAFVGLDRDFDLVFALIDGRVVGMTALTGNVIKGLYVDLQTEGKGIGSGLVTKLLEVAFNNSLEYVEIVTGAHTQKFYSKFGFEFVENIELTGNVISNKVKLKKNL